MRRRHRIPSIFSLSMLDVLCCALGAMLLLMLLNHLDARRAYVAREQTEDRLKLSESALNTSQEELALVQMALASARTELSEKDKLFAAHEQDKRSLQQQLNQMDAKTKQEARRQSQLQTRLDQLEQELKTSRALLEQARRERDESDQLLAQQIKEYADSLAQAKQLQKKMSQQTEQLESLNRKLEMTEKEKTEAATLAQELAAAQQDLKASQQRIEALESDLVKLRKQAEAAGVKLGQAEARVKEIHLDNETLRQLLTDQQITSGKLRQETQRLANRFAGVDLSGKRVVLLVDRSGSMGAVDDKTAAPEKWPELCRTVAQVLRSMPEVEQFQLVAFSDQVEFPLGQAGQWLKNEPNAAKQVEEALLRTLPKGNTNLYAAFEAAFRFKSQGMDTIFLFSDGLPNVGPGLPDRPPPDEASQSAILGKHLRDTLRQRWNKDEPRVKINSIGYFYESPNLGAFLWALSREHQGSFVGMSRP